MTNPPNSQFIIYQTEDGQTKLDVRFQNENVWLTQNHMAELFQTSSDNISLHLKNIFTDGELIETGTTEDFSVVRKEGSWQVKRKLEHYNLDAIISVDHAGKVSHEMAMQLASDEYEKFKAQRLQIEEEQADKKDFETLAKKISEQDTDQINER